MISGEKIYRWPQFKEVRMVEFTVQLLQSFAKNFRASLIVWEKVASSELYSKKTQSEAAGFPKVWTEKKS